jgi:hypothetical protein
MQGAFLCCLLFVALVLDGTAQCSREIGIAFRGERLEITWIGNAQLQQALSPDGPWQSVADTSPYQVDPAAPQAFFRLAVTQQVSDRETIFFYNAETGAAAIGAVEGNKFVTRSSFADGFFSLGWTHIVQNPGQGDTLFFYRRSDLSGALGLLGVDSFATYRSYPPNSFGDWTHIAGFAGDEAGLLLYYNAETGNSCCDNLAPGSGWTHLVEARHSGTILFYKAGDGSGMLGFAAPPLIGLPAEASHVATSPRPAGGDFVLFYRSGDNSGEFGRMDGSGYHRLHPYGPGSFGDWTHVVGLDHGFFFYNSETGEGAIGVVTLADTFATVATYGPGAFALDWTHIVRAEVNDRMQGFCWPLSAAAGETIDFYASTGARAYSVSYVRFRNENPDWVDFYSIQNNRELVEELLCGPFSMTGGLQNTAHSPDDGCFDWDISFSLVVPSDWASGIYAAKLLDNAGSVTYVPFVVNPEFTQRAKLALIANVTTWNAYNSWGGYSRYEVPGDGAWGFSFLRPNHRLINLSASDRENRAYNYAYMSKHLARGELWVLNWLKDAGYAVDVYTDLDLHDGIADLSDYKGLILSTHPEYFSVQMLSELNDYLAKGGNLLYLGANGIYDAVDVSDDLKQITIHGTSGCGRSHLFRRDPVSQPESAVLGVAFPWSPSCDPTCGGDLGNLAHSRVSYRVIDASHPFFNETDLSNDDFFGADGWCVDDSGSSGYALSAGGASGWEVDVIDANSPGGVQLLALGANPDTLNCTPYSDVSLAAHMVYYDHPGGGFVFSVGSMSFGGSLVVDPKIQKIVRNALDACLH